ncbi:MAG: hypothetical protein VB055_09540 [Oscillospiraceae bacterium]|nr:hypothetical protein [Oscillospiraceae bacterium]
MEKKARKLLRIGAILLVFLLLTPCVLALSDGAETDSGFSADSLTIRVGYFGGPYYEKKVLSLAELESMMDYEAVYSFVDNKPSVVYDKASGIRLSTILAQAGVFNTDEVAFYQFHTADSGSGYWTSRSGSFLFETRYSYRNLAEYAKQSAGGGRAITLTNYDAVISSAEQVEPMLAIYDSWARYSYGETFNEAWHDGEGRTSRKRLRLLYGQTTPYEIMASQSAKYVNAVDIQLKGSPSLNVEGDLELKVSADHTLSVSVGYQDGAAVLQGDPVITNAILSGLRWESDNESVAKVAYESGQWKLVAVGEGTATISVHFDDFRDESGNPIDITSSLTVTVKNDAQEETGGGGTGTGSGSEEGGGTGGSGEIPGGDGSGETGSGENGEAGNAENGGEAGNAENGGEAGNAENGGEVGNEITPTDTGNPQRPKTEEPNVYITADQILSDTIPLLQEEMQAESETPAETETETAALGAVETAAPALVRATRISIGSTSGSTIGSAQAASAGTASSDSGSPGGSALLLNVQDNPLQTLALLCALLLFLIGGGGMFWKYKHEF